MTVTPVQLREKGRTPSLFQAVSGNRQTLGTTAGQALDNLLAQEGKDIESSVILVQRFVPDHYFTQAQHDRMQTLLSHRTDLNVVENAELDALVDAELEATIARTPLSAT